MPRGPKGERRPADVIGNAGHVMKIATGEIATTFPTMGKTRRPRRLERRAAPREQRR